MYRQTTTWKSAIHTTVLAALGLSLLFVFSTMMEARAQNVGGLAPNMIFFEYNKPECPDGTTLVAQGRLIAGTRGGGLGTTVGEPRGDQTPPTHTHTIQTLPTIT